MIVIHFPLFHQLIIMLPFMLILLLLSALDTTGAQSIGVCYGRVADNLPSAEEVIGLFKAYGIGKMRLYDPDIPTFQALRGSNIELSVGVPNQLLQSFATNAAAATQWVQNNIQTYANDVKFRYIIVGNEIMHHDAEAQFVAPAMQNIYNALASVNLQTQIKVSTAIQLGLLISSYPPSSGAFGTASTAYITPILSFLVKNEAPLLANLYTYFSYIGDPIHISLDYALFTSPGTVVKDGQYEYSNIFDASLDALYAALEKLGAPNLEVVISESGWPSDGGLSATIDNANTYYGNLAKHVKNGTPRRPNKPLETYFFAMFDEDKKGPAETERHFGLFHPNKQPKYPILTETANNNDQVLDSSSPSLTKGGMFPSFLVFVIVFLFL